MNIHEKAILILWRNYLRRQDVCFDAINYGWLHDDAEFLLYIASFGCGLVAECTDEHLPILRIFWIGIPGRGSIWGSNCRL
jgi:hypothetical protein